MELLVSLTILLKERGQFKTYMEFLFCFEIVCTRMRMEHILILRQLSCCPDILLIPGSLEQLLAGTTPWVADPQEPWQTICPVLNIASAWNHVQIGSTDSLDLGWVYHTVFKALNIELPALGVGSRTPQWLVLPVLVLPVLGFLLCPPTHACSRHDRHIFRKGKMQTELNMRP